MAAILNGPLIGILGLLIAVVGFFVPRPTAQHRYATLVIAAGLALLFIPFKATANNSPAFSCGSVVTPRTDFSQLPTNFPTSGNPVNDSLASIGFVTADMAKSTCASEHHWVEAGALFMVVGGAIELWTASRKRQSGDEDKEAES